MKASELIGKRIRIVVNATPCRCVYPGCDILERTTEGVVTRWEHQPAGLIGFLRTDEGELICFDAAGDISSGKIELELRGHHPHD
jgi:hypothetical protein